VHWLEAERLENHDLQSAGEKVTMFGILCHSDNSTLKIPICKIVFLPKSSGSSKYRTLSAELEFRATAGVETGRNGRMLPYSLRNARIGSTEAARRAGINAANNEHRNSTMSALVITDTSSGFTP